MHCGLVLIVRFHLSGEAAEEESEVNFLVGEESEEIPREVEISGARVEEPELTGEPLLVGTSERAGEFVEDSFELFPGVLRAVGQLHAALEAILENPFAAAAGMDLAFHHHAVVALG